MPLTSPHCTMLVGIPLGGIKATRASALPTTTFTGRGGDPISVDALDGEVGGVGSVVVVSGDPHLQLAVHGLGESLDTIL